MDFKPSRSARRDAVFDRFGGLVFFERVYQSELPSALAFPHLPCFTVSGGVGRLAVAQPHAPHNAPIGQGSLHLTANAFARYQAVSCGGCRRA